MSADLLRRAAALMRERAEVATRGPWVQTKWPKLEPSITIQSVPGVFSQPLADADELDPEVARTLDVPDAVYIASWHPVVTLAVADWLDTLAGVVGPSDINTMSIGTQWNYAQALTVARLYLGEDA